MMARYSLGLVLADKDAWLPPLVALLIVALLIAFAGLMMLWAVRQERRRIAGR